MTEVLTRPCDWPSCTCEEPCPALLDESAAELYERVDTRGYRPRLRHGWSLTMSGEDIKKMMEAQ